MFTFNRGGGGIQVGVGDMAKISYHNYIYIYIFFFWNITILSRFFVMLVLLFCKLPEYYNQTYFPIIKTKPFKVTEYKKSV